MAVATESASTVPAAADDDLLHLVIFAKLRNPLKYPIPYSRTGWRRGVAVERRTRDQEVVKTLGKFLTPMCLCHHAV